MRYKDFYQHLFERAYHGSPHKFNKFSMGKVNSGEGAQAFGHGLYFSELKDVADSYRIGLSYDPDKMKINGKQIKNEYDYIEKKAMHSSSNHYYEIMDGLERLMLHSTPKEVMEYGEEMGWSKEAMDYFKNAKFKTFGSIYTVEINDEAAKTFLDWDKSLSEQNEIVKEILKKWMIEKREDGKQWFEESQNLKGYGIYHLFFDDDKDSKENRIIASERLKNIGIKGIKYIDSGSGKNTINYVLFDENDVEILERNGKPVSKKIKDDMIKVTKKNS